MHDKIENFLSELAQYIGHAYLSHEQIVFGDDTRFDQLNFDLVDEVVVEHLIQKHFDMPDWTCDSWPNSVGDLIGLIREQKPGA